MRLLLDTHALLWWWVNDERLSKSARTAIGRMSNEIFVSVVSAWEIATKVRLGKLPSQPDIVQRFASLVTADGFTPLPVSLRHALHAGSYPQQHGDPFDRMLAAQSELEGLTLVTLDPAMGRFPCQTHW